MKPGAVIELNGRRYNAATGEPIEGGHKSLDGFVVGTPPQPALPPTPAEPHHLGVQRGGQHHAQHHPLQHSKTLMRQSVHRPSDGLKRHANTTGHTGTLVKAPRFDITPKHSAQLVDPDRLRRAGQVPPSDYVRRFAASPAAQPRNEPTLAPQANVSYPAAPEAPPERQPSDDVFERALAAASSHQEQYIPTKHRAKRTHHVRTITSIAASVLAIALIVGFIGYQNMALLQFRLASSKAGISATMPIWQPTGFKLGSLTSVTGNVALTYKNAASDQSYTISQSSTNWNAAALLSAYVYPNNETYDTLTAGGTTIYTYGNNNATWISGGIWYKLISSGSLSNSQIVNIATSMRS